VAILALGGNVKQFKMASLHKKTIQLRMSSALYSQARAAMEEIEEVGSFNDFAVNAIKEEVKRAREAKIDAAFARMGKDEKYLRVSAEISRDFAKSDLETLKLSEEK
jgi:hypothetical protein